MRIALISYEYPPETGLGGIGTYTAQAACMLADRGHSVEVFAGALEKDSSELDGKVLLHRVYPGKDRHAFPLAVALKFRERHQFQAFDIIEGPEYKSDGLSILKEFPRIPHTVKLHTPSFLIKKLFFGKVGLLRKARSVAGSLLKGKRPNPYWAYSKEKDPEYEFTRSVPFILHPSFELGGIVSREWNIPIGRFIHLQNPFQPGKEFLSIGIPQKADDLVRVTFLGKLERRKGIFLLLEAMPAILQQYPQVRFRFVGKSHPSPNPGMDMQAYIEKTLSGYKDKLEFTGPIPYTQIPAQLAETDICIFPSLWENFPNVCLEAMSAGRAVIGSKNGGMAEMLGEEECGLLIDPDNPKTIVAALKKMIENPQLRYRFGQLAREKVLREYSWDRIGARTEEVYSMIIDHWPKA